MRRALAGSMLSILALAACRDDGVVVVDDGVPAAPEAVSVSYYAGVVNLSWELAPDWDGEAFRIYSRRVTDAEFFFIAEVTSCTDGFCTYQDLNVAAGETYEYFVSAVSPGGTEVDSGIVEVFVPSFTPPPVPNAPSVIALDNSLYLTWGDASRDAGDFSFYRVYQSDGPDEFLLGETDSEGFVDLLAGNGSTYSYFVTSVDTDGHESGGSAIASGTPRPDYHGELIRSRLDFPDESGFIFVEDEITAPIVPGNDPLAHFVFEEDVDGFWLVSGVGTQVHQNGVATTALKCGPGADFDCVDLQIAPGSGYTTNDVPLSAGFSYAMRVEGDDGLTHYGVIRVEHLGFDQNGAIMIFDWAYQLVPDSPDLTPKH